MGTLDGKVAVDRRELVRLPPGWSPGLFDASAPYPSGQAPKPAARAFVRFLQDLLRDLADPPPGASEPRSAQDPVQREER